MNQQLLISQRDEARLRRMIATLRSNHGTDREGLELLAAELDRARILPDSEIPPDIVRLGSRVELEDLSDGEILIRTLVLPNEAEANLGRLSVLAPLGTALLGYRTGDDFRWPVPGGILHARIRSVGLPSSEPRFVA